MTSPTESPALLLAEHVAECGAATTGDPCDECDELLIATLEWDPVWPCDEHGCPYGGEAG